MSLRSIARNGANDLLVHVFCARVDVGGALFVVHRRLEQPGAEHANREKSDHVHRTCRLRTALRGGARRWHVEHYVRQPVPYREGAFRRASMR